MERLRSDAVPPGLSGVTAIAAGYHNLALKNDGTVVAWGDNELWSDDGAGGADRGGGDCRRWITVWR